MVTDVDEIWQGIWHQRNESNLASCCTDICGFNLTPTGASVPGQTMRTSLS